MLHSKRPHFSIIANLPISIIIAIMGFFPNSNQPINRVEEIHSRHIARLSQTIDLGNKFLSSLKDKDIGQSKASFAQFRLGYKKSEYLAAYTDQEFVNNYINAPPFPRLEKNTASIIIIGPQGFQIIEEQLFLNEPNINWQYVVQLTQRLLDKLLEFKNFQERTPFTDRFFFEAARQQLIRISTLGISGADSPSHFSITDTQTSLKTLLDDFQLYYDMVSGKKPQLALKINQLLEKGINHCNNTTFDHFDRAFFIREISNPLYALFLDAHTITGIEKVYEVQPSYYKMAVNYEARSFIANDFLNKPYFMKAPSFQTTPEIIALGKILFFDPIISHNNKRSCASCHNPKLAFTDGLPKSRAFDNKDKGLSRNAPTLINAVYSDRFFYDMRTLDLEDQIDHVVMNPKEFNTNYGEIVGKLKQSLDYKYLFNNAFPSFSEDERISSLTIKSAIGQYVASLKSFNSPFDQYLRKETYKISQEAINGFNLFMGKASCGTCHFLPTYQGLVPPLFQDSESEVLGVPSFDKEGMLILDQDPGRIQGHNKERGAHIYNHSFKTMTVRNIQFTAPYMHNGIYNTLDEVVNFYDQGGGQGLGLNVPNQTLPFDKLHLNEEEKRNIISFMKMLSDTTNLTSIPSSLPGFPNEAFLNQRKISGEY